MKVMGTSARLLRRAPFVGLTVLLAAAALTGAVPASAGVARGMPTVTQVQLFSGNATVKSSSGRKLRLQVLANQIPGTSASDVNVNLSDGPRDVGEVA
jgi:hypothetical protein